MSLITLDNVSKRYMNGADCVIALQELSVAVEEGSFLGVMGPSGSGKSTLLSMMARNTDADLAVVALIGERGREVREFLERDLGPEGLARSVVVVVTSDESAVMRAKGAETAMTIAESFRDQDREVLLLMDSVTRYAMALREIGLAAGEPPTTRGYPPSSFAVLPEIVEQLLVLALASPDDRRQEVEARLLRQGRDLVADVGQGPAGRGHLAVGTVDRAAPGVEQAEEVVDLGDRTHR